MLDFFQGKTILITGHTGFKGSWLSVMLEMAGAKVIGYALKPPQGVNLFGLSHAAEGMVSIEGDVRDYRGLKAAFEKYHPELAIHMAAQPIVRESYKNPRGTYETNVMGTVNLLECVRETSGVASVLNVTTDKVYENKEWTWGYRETDPLDGYDPYSNSKSCSELATHSYKKSFLDGKQVPVSTARAGNVIGGGDFAKDRIIPDCVRAALSHQPILVRNPSSVRPFQHVLEPLKAYLMILEQQMQAPEKQGYYNVGPGEEGCVSAGRLADLFCQYWQDGVTWENTSGRSSGESHQAVSQKLNPSIIGGQSSGGSSGDAHEAISLRTGCPNIKGKRTSGNSGEPHEAAFLKLDCSSIKSRIGWQPRWQIGQAVEKTVEWFRVYESHGNVRDCMEQQIREFLMEGPNGLEIV